MGNGSALSARGFDVLIQLRMACAAFVKFRFVLCVAVHAPFHGIRRGQRPAIFVAMTGDALHFTVNVFLMAEYDLFANLSYDRVNRMIRADMAAGTAFVRIILVNVMAGTAHFMVRHARPSGIIHFMAGIAIQTFIFMGLVDEILAPVISTVLTDNTQRGACTQQYRQQGDHQPVFCAYIKHSQILHHRY
jgi:hypothetical protein